MKNTYIWLLLGSLFSAAPMYGEIREWTDKSGRVVRAEILSSSRGKVEIRREDGRKFEVWLDTLSDADQAYVSKWVESNLLQSDYTFGIAVKRHRKKEKAKGSDGDIVSYNAYFEVIITNKSADDVMGVDVVYRVYKKEGEELSEASADGEGDFVEGTHKIGLLEPRDGSAFSTDPLMVPLTDEYGYSIKSKSDGMEGVWVKIYKKDKLVREFCQPTALKKKYRWDEE